MTTEGYYDFLRKREFNPSSDVVEDRDIITTYHHWYEAERRASGGQIPIVCVAGKHMYESLMGTLQTLYGMPVVQDKSSKERMFEFMGTTVIPSYSMTGRFVFGSEDSFSLEQKKTKKPEPTLAEKIADAAFQQFLHFTPNSKQTCGQALVTLIEKILAEHKDNGPA